MTHNATPTKGNKKRLTRAQRTTLGLGAVGAAAVIGIGGVFATFTGTVTSATQNIATGSAPTMAVDPATGSSTAAFEQTVADMVPGDVNNRFMNIRNSGTRSLSSATLTVPSSPGTTKLATDATNGLQIRVDTCSVAWVLPSGTCAGTTTTVVTQQSLNALKTAKTMGGFPVAAGGTLYLRVTHLLPTTADNTFKSLNEVLTYKFDFTQA